MMTRFQVATAPDQEIVTKSSVRPYRGPTGGRRVDSWKEGSGHTALMNPRNLTSSVCLEECWVLSIQSRMRRGIWLFCSSLMSFAPDIMRVNMLDGCMCTLSLLYLNRPPTCAPCKLHLAPKHRKISRSGSGGSTAPVATVIRGSVCLDQSCTSLFLACSLSLCLSLK